MRCPEGTLMSTRGELSGATALLRRDSCKKAKAEWVNPADRDMLSTRLQQHSASISESLHTRRGGREGQRRRTSLEKVGVDDGVDFVRADAHARRLRHVQRWEQVCTRRGAVRAEKDTGSRRDGRRRLRGCRAHDRLPTSTSALSAAALLKLKQDDSFPACQGRTGSSECPVEAGVALVVD
jgi:hypothetical protein